MDIFMDPMDDGRLYQKTIWMRNEDEMRLNRLADRLDISKSEVIMVALKLYEDGLNAVEESRRRGSSFEVVLDTVKKADQGLVRLGEDVGEPIDPERLRELRELLGTRPDDCPICAMNNRQEFIFEPKK